MLFTRYRQRFYATLVILGAGFLLYRTVAMLSQGALEVFVTWVCVLLFAEMLTDAACVLASIPWWTANDRAKDRLPLRLVAAMVYLHAARVLVFVLGKTGPWINFDVRPEQRAIHHTRWTWGEVWFAGIMSALALACVIIIWLLRRKAGKRQKA